MALQQNIPPRRVVFFAYIRKQGITEHFCNMALAVSRHTDLLVIYDKRIESGNNLIHRLRDNNIECIDASELKKVTALRLEKVSFLFHCNGFAHLRSAIKVSRSTDKIMISVHCFRHALWYAKGFAFLTYFLFSKSVDMWHFLSYKSRDEYFWFRNIPSNTCVYPLGVEKLFMSEIAELCAVKDLEGEEITDLPNRVNIVYIAQLQPWKRHLFLLRSLQHILKGNTYLYLLGEGPLIKKLMTFARELGIRDHVIFTGKVNRKTVHCILSHARLAVTVSPSETFGWCVLEPFCMNVPIVTTDVGIANSIINDFRNGFIVDVNCEEEEFRNKVKYALEHMQNVDNSSMNNLYSWQTYGRITANCYSSIFKIEVKVDNKSIFYYTKKVR